MSQIFNKQQKRHFYALYLDLCAGLRRLRYDFANELVVFISAFVLLGLFYYMFNDFINGKLAAISPSLREVAAYYTGMALILAGSIGGSWRLIVNTRNAQFANWLIRLGESPRGARLSELTGLVVKVTLLNLVVFAATRKLFGPMAGTVSCSAFAWAISVLLCGLSVRMKSQSVAKKSIKTWSSLSSTKIATMSSWRLWQIRNTSTTATALSIGYLLGLILLSISIVFVGNTPVAIVLAMVIGLFAAAAMGQQFAVDVNLFWAERNMSVAHEDIMRAYFRISQYYLLPTLLLMVFVLIVMGSLGQLSNAKEVITIVQIFAASACAPAITPALLFQLDPRRPWLQIAANGLLSLFLVTAIYVHLLSVALIPLLVYYANQTQHNRFYRA